MEDSLNTKGLLALRHGGRDFVTYNHFQSDPEGLGTRIIGFARKHLADRGAIRAFGRKVAAIAWIEAGARTARAFHPQGADLLEAIAAGEIRSAVCGDDLYRACLECEYAYILDLDEGVLECWDLRDKVRTLPLASDSAHPAGDPVPWSA